MKKSSMKRGEIYLWELGSMKELRRAERKIDRAIKNFEKNFGDELDEALEMFSWRDTITCVLGAADALQSIIRYRNRDKYTSFGSGLLTGLKWHYHRRKARKSRMCEHR